MAGEVKSVVLLVEDDLGDQKLMRDALSQQETTSHLEIVGTGEEALEYLDRTKDDDSVPRPHLILLDLNMPGMGGKDFLKKLKADEQLNSIPVVILTTSDADRDVLETYQLQAAGYIKKPASLKGFQEIMHDLTNDWFVMCKRG